MLVLFDPGLWYSDSQSNNKYLGNTATYNRTTKIKFKKFKTSLRISPQNRSHIRKCLTRQSLVNYNKCFFYTYVTYVIQDGQTGILYYVLRLSEFVRQIGPTDLLYSRVECGIFF